MFAAAIIRQENKLIDHSSVTETIILISGQLIGK